MPVEGAMAGCFAGSTVVEGQRALDALEARELLLRQAVGRIRLAAALANVPGGADWRGPAERAFSAVRDELRQSVEVALVDVERALAETRNAITTTVDGLARGGPA
jgi:hypothetical protein